MTRTEIGASYDSRADEYIDLFGSVDQLSGADRDLIAGWRAKVSGRILDAGCGPGQWSRFLAETGTGEVVGVDASSGFLSSARARHRDLALARADLAALPLADSSVGGVLAWYSIIHTPPAGLPSILSELARVLTPGGSLLLGYFDGTPEEPFDHAVHTAYYWSAQALGDLLAEHGLVIGHAETRQDPGVRRRHGELIATLA
ncbi:methyltransferase family protein [Nocardioides albertanoniae]|uniref:Methyltransferase family protein n=1 Tax=Nocardioides albertanoniae TaxID=1175486 RepID=A0A543A864_9ACTN|nr:class I SAM-dependent methyltransferase [Nocardioides albertanoniae]TQL68785.1 methyltransferase family protein [Nocardioides albertanoniae]